MIYNVFFSPSDVESIMVEKRQGSESGLVAFYSFDLFNALVVCMEYSLFCIPPSLPLFSNYSFAFPPIHLSLSLILAITLPVNFLST
jgi:hypothetical protein